MSWYPELQAATMRQLVHYSLICHATGIEWPDIDYHLSIEGMLVSEAIRRVA